MGADLAIHIFDEKTMKEEHIKAFFSSTLGSKHFSGFFVKTRKDRELEDEAKTLVMKTKSVEVGGVSWLKAAVTEDNDTYVPLTVKTVLDLIGEDLPVLDEELLNKILEAFDEPNTTTYSLNKKQKVEKFLKENMGKRLFTVSW